MSEDMNTPAASTTAAWAASQGRRTLKRTAKRTSSVHEHTSTDTGYTPDLAPDLAPTAAPVVDLDGLQASLAVTTFPAGNAHTLPPVVAGFPRISPEVHLNFDDLLGPATEPTPTFEIRDAEALTAQLQEHVTAAAERAVTHTLELLFGTHAARLEEQARAAQSSHEALTESMRKCREANPETVTMLRGEIARRDQEIATLQRELDRTRRVVARYGEGAGARFWMKMGQDLGADAMSVQDVLARAPSLDEGRITPEVGRALKQAIVTLCGSMEAFADNCTAYAEDLE